MNKIINSLEDIKEMLNVKIDNIETTPLDRHNYIGAYYDVCMVQEKIQEGSSRLEIKKEPTAVSS